MKPWKLLASETALSTKWLTVFKKRFQIGDGSVIDDYYIVERKDFVLVVATCDNKITLVKQYRPATEAFYYALPAGYIDSEETPLEAATRELHEETGQQAVNPRLIGELHPLPGYINSTAFVVASDATPGAGRILDEQEIEQVIRVTWDTCLEMIVKGEMREMQAVSAILLARQVSGMAG